MTTHAPLEQSADDAVPASRASTSGADGSEPQHILQTSADPRNIALWVLAMLAIIFVLQWAQQVLIPFVLSILLSYALDPVVTRMARWGIHRAIGAALIIMMFLSGIVSAGFTLSDEFAVVLNKLPGAAHKLSLSISGESGNTKTTINNVQKAANELEKATSAATGSTPGTKKIEQIPNDTTSLNVVDVLWAGTMGLMAFLGQALVVIFTTYFLLVSGDLFKRKLVKIRGPTLAKKRITVQILDEIDLQIQRFMMVQLFTSFVVGIVSWLAFRWIGLEQAAMWGLLAGIFNSVPYLGPVVVTGSITLIAIMQFGSVSMGVLVGGVALVITSIEGFLLTPWLTSCASKMNAVVVFVGVLFWGWLWGVWGLLLGVPILMAIKSVCDHIEDLQPIGELLGD